MTTDLSNKTVEELRLIVATEPYEWSATDAFDELATRLRAAQEQIVAQQARIADLIDALTVWEGYISIDLEGDDLSALAADRAEVAAKALEEFMKRYRGAAGENWVKTATSISREMIAEYRAKAKGDKP